MTRNEEILKEALNWKIDDNEFIAQTAFEAGAKWADEHPQSPWISTEERLPKIDEKVLLHFESVISPDIGVLEECKDHKYWRFTFFTLPFKDVDYWMPIPELPKGGEK